MRCFSGIYESEIVNKQLKLDFEFIQNHISAEIFYKLIATTESNNEICSGNISWYVFHRQLQNGYSRFFKPTLPGSETCQWTTFWHNKGR